MPLDNARKIAHIQAVVQRAWQGRQKTVVFVYNNAGSYTYSAQTVIFRPQNVIGIQQGFVEKWAICPQISSNLH